MRALIKNERREVIAADAIPGTLYEYAGVAYLCVVTTFSRTRIMIDTTTWTAVGFAGSTAMKPLGTLEIRE